MIVIVEAGDYLEWPARCVCIGAVRRVAVGVGSPTLIRLYVAAIVIAVVLDGSQMEQGVPGRELGRYQCVRYLLEQEQPELSILR